MRPGVHAVRDGVLHLQLYCVPLVFKPTNNSLFIFSVFFWGISRNKRTLGAVCFLSSHVPIEIFLFHKIGKKWGNQKRVVLLKGQFLYLCILLGVGNTHALGSHSWVALPKENALVGGASPTTKPTCGDKHGSALCTQTWFSFSSPVILFYYWDSIDHLQQYVMIAVDPFQAYQACLEWVKTTMGLLEAHSTSESGS
jgi:hypothetical protein